MGASPWEKELSGGACVALPDGRKKCLSAEEAREVMESVVDSLEWLGVLVRVEGRDAAADASKLAVRLPPCFALIRHLAARSGIFGEVARMFRADAWEAVVNTVSFCLFLELHSKLHGYDPSSALLPMSVDEEQAVFLAFLKHAVRKVMAGLRRDEVIRLYREALGL